MSRSSERSRGAPVRDRPLATFLWAFVAVGICLGAWSVATPIGAAPDEPEHIIQATALFRGQFNSEQVPAHYGPFVIGKMGKVRVPAWVVANRNPRAIFYPPVCPTDSSCNINTPPAPSSTRTVTSATQFFKYPPLYYVLVGGPSVLATGTGALYGMRFLAVLFDALLIALGLTLLARYHRRPVLVGALVALTPTVLFMGAVVNASGIEIAAAFAAWCGGLSIAAAKEVPRSLVGWTALAFVVLVLTRPNSPANALVILAVLGVLCGWKRCRELASTLRPLAGALIGALVVAAGFLLVFGAPGLVGVGERPRLSVVGSVRETFRLMGGQFRQTIGVFGWLDLVAPAWVIVIWVVAVAVLVGYALVVSPRARRALPVLALAIVASPLVLETHVLNTVGPYWQGRYWLPLAMGLPLLATAEVVLRRWIVITFGIALAVAQLGAFVTTLDAYDGHPKTPGSAALWHPPGGTTLTIAFFVLGQVLLVGFVWANTNKRRNVAAVASRPERTTASA